ARRDRCSAAQSRHRLARTHNQAGGSTMSVAGRIVWHDLMTNDVEGARRFYAELFAWRIKTEGGWPFIYPPGGEDHSGAVMDMSGPPRPSHWVPYIAVENLAATMEAITGAGGKLHTGKI